ncbi:MAG: VWA domain-containing protein [Bacteroidota bacterium]
MKKIILFLISIFLLNVLCFSQADFKYTVTVKGKNGYTLPDVKVWLTDKIKGKTITQRTNSAGVAVFKLGEGYWTLNLPGLANYKEFEISENEKGEGDVSLTYDLATIKSEAAFLEQRNRTTFTSEDQTLVKASQPGKGMCIVDVKLSDALKNPLYGISVSLVSVKQAKMFNSKTLKTGVARFLVPIGENYAVDVDGVKNFSFSGDLKFEGIVTLTLPYEPTTIKETVRNDTIRQIIPVDAKATSARVFQEINVTDASGNPLQNEWVYVQQIVGNKVYEARTGKDGKAIFLLPRGEKYMLHFEFQRDVDVLNFITTKGRAHAQMSLSYRPDPRLQHPEKFIPKPEEVFLEEFQTFITKQLPDPGFKKLGLTVQWGNGKVNESSKEAVLKIGIAGATQDVVFKNVPNIDVAFVLDRSGSMAGYDRIEALKKSMVKFADKLRPEDFVALVTFNGEAFLDMPLKAKGNGEQLKKYISEIEPDGFTDIFKALVIGYEQLLTSPNKERVHQVILLSDGYDGSETKTLLDKSKEYNQKGLRISAIGVGQDYNYSLLTLLAGESGGVVEFAPTANDMDGAFEKQLSNVMFPIASSAKLDIIFNEKIKFDKIYGLPLKSKMNDRATLDVGPLYRGCNVVAIASFQLNKPAQGIENMPVILELSYQDLQSGTREKITEKAFLTWEPGTGKLALILEQEQKKLYAIAIINQSIKVMAEAFAAGSLKEASLAVASAERQVKELFPDASDKDVQKLVAQITLYAKAIENFQRNQNKKK